MNIPNKQPSNNIDITTQDVIRSYAIEIRPPKGYETVETFDHENKLVIVEIRERNKVSPWNRSDNAGRKRGRHNDSDG